MHLLTWHGTIICQPDQTGVFTHRALPLEGIGPAPLDIDLPQGRAIIRHPELGTLEVRRAGHGAAIVLVRNGRFGCAERGSGKLVFDREAAAAWEYFLPLTGQVLADLLHIVSYRWIEMATRRLVRRRTIGLGEGFKLHLGTYSVDLARSLEGLVTVRGLNGLPINLAVLDAGKSLELVVAEPRSSALIETAPWPVRSRRVAEILTLAVHRHFDGIEPTQDTFERDVAFLEANGGPPALEDLLEELTLSAAADRHGAGAPRMDVPAARTIDDKLAAAQRLIDEARSAAAQAAFERIAEDHPDDPRAWFRLGDLLQAAGDYTACVATWERCLEIAPDHAEAAGRLAYMAGSLGRPLDAIARLEAALVHQPGAMEKRVVLATRYAELGWLDRAVAAFKAIGEPLRSWMEANRRNTEKSLADQRESLDRLVAGQARAPGSQPWDTIVQRAQAALALGELDLCTAAIDELLDQDSDRAEPHLLRAGMALRTASLDAALATLGKAPAKARLDPAFVVFRARLDYYAGQYEQAERALARLVVEKPRDDAFKLLCLTALCLEDVPALGRAARAWLAFNDRSSDAGIFALASARADGRLARLDDMEPDLPGVPHPVIVQFWHAAEKPADVAQAMATWPERNPGLGHFVFNDNSARAFLAENCTQDVLECYESAHHPAMQSDIFRLAYLHARGGIYVDADDICTRDMRRVFAALNQVDLIAPQSTETPPYVNNAFIAARPGCPIIAEALAEAVRVVAEHVAGGRRPDIWQVTGPGLLTRKIGRFVADPAYKGRVLLLSDTELHAFSITEDFRYKHSADGDWRLAPMPAKAPVRRTTSAIAPEASAKEVDDDVLTAWAMREMAPWQANRVSREAANQLYERWNNEHFWIALYRLEDGQVELAPKPANLALPPAIVQRAQSYLRFLRTVARQLPAGFRTTLCVGVGDGVPCQYSAPVFCFHKTVGSTTPLLPDTNFLDFHCYEGPEFQDNVPYEMKENVALFVGATTGGHATPEIARNCSLPRLRAAKYFVDSKLVDFRITSIVQCSSPEAEAILRAQPFCQRPPLSRAEQFKRRFTISMDGNGATWSRVVVALLSHCVLLKYDSQSVTYFYGGLQPWLHYVPISQDSDIERVLEMEAADPARFARIAANGRAFALAYLNSASVHRYTALLLQCYDTALIDEPPPLRVSAAEIDTTKPKIADGQGVADGLPADQAGTDQIGKMLMAWAMHEMAPWQARPAERAAAEALFNSLNETHSWVCIYRFENGGVTMAPKPDTVEIWPVHAGRAQYYLNFFRAVVRFLPAGFSTTLCMGLADGLPAHFDAPVFCFSKNLGSNTPLVPDIDFLAYDFYQGTQFQDNLPYEGKEQVALFVGAPTGGAVTLEVAQHATLPRLRAAKYFVDSPNVDFRITNIEQVPSPEAQAFLRTQPFCQRPPLSREEQFKRRFIISMDGNGATGSRVAIALLSNCVLMKYDSQKVMYFYGGLQPWLHYVPIAQDSDVDRVLDMEAKDPDRFASIAASSRAFAQTYLNADSVHRYTAYLLQYYEATLAGSQPPKPVPEVAPKAAPQATPAAWPAPGAEPVRMVIWDLDETFWGGTLTEGGITWRPENAALVRMLAERGIPSTICSKNDPEPVRRVLEEHGLLDYFVFADISWAAKGPRLAALVQAVQLRAESLLFIDDNPANRAEAAAFVPGLQIAAETIIPELANHSLLQGKPDPELSRLAQYRLLERRHVAHAEAGGTEDFLRASGITVAFEFDVDSHLDRAIELINRTNQLNFTKNRLPEAPEEARAQLRKLLAQYDVQAALLRVRDNFGDHGFVGFYLVLTAPHPHLLYFAFSCRILGMGLETWLYRRIGRPALNVVGEVLSDPVGDPREIDWISAEIAGAVSSTADAPRPLRYMLARGACDMRAISHYCHTLTDRMVEEYAGVRGKQTVFGVHPLVTTQVMAGFPEAATADFAQFGFQLEDLTTALATGLPEGPGAWLMGFGIARDLTVYRHKATGALMPFHPAGLNIAAECMMRGDPCDVDPAIVAQLREKFEWVGPLPDDMFQSALRLIFARAPANVRVFVTLSNTEGSNPDGTPRPLVGFRQHNTLIRQVAADYPNVELIDPRDFMTEATDAAKSKTPHHFDRLVYFRIFQHIAGRINALFPPA